MILYLVQISVRHLSGGHSYMNKALRQQSQTRDNNRRPALSPFVLYCVLFSLGALLVLWKCRYGIANIDEAFYLTVPYRLVQGDALFVEEWHLSQMSGLLLYPFVALYLRIVGSTNGIILAFRYLFTVCNIVASIFVFYRLKRYQIIGAAAASLSLLLFAPYGIMALSYNSMGILCMILTCTILLTEKEKRLQVIMAGVLFAFAVLCNPYLIALYLLALALFVVMFLPFRKFRTESFHIFRMRFGKRLLNFTLGSVVVAVIFLVFLLSRASLSEILQALPFMFDDPEHPTVSLIDKGISYLYHVIVVNRYTKYCYLGLGLLIALCIVDKKRMQHKFFYFTGVTVGVSFLLFAIYFRNHTLNYLMWPLNCFAPFILLLSERKETRQIFSFFWVSGILYSFCMHLSSNQNFYAISSASIVALIGSLIMIAIFSGEVLATQATRLQKIGVSALLSLMLVGLLGTEAHERYVNIFWDTSIETQTSLIDEGINKGIYVSEGMYQEYYQDLAIVHSIKKAAPDAERVLFFAYKPQYYLMTDSYVGSYSAWLSLISKATVDRLTAFYEMNPTLMPDVIYVDPQYSDYAKLLSESIGCRKTSFDHGMLLVRGVDEKLD